MKKTKKTLAVFTSLFGSVFLFFMMASCASLQQDVYTYTADNVYIYNLIGIYENQFIEIDEKYHSENQVPAAEINELLAEINSYRSSTKVSEPFLKARLKAFEGLLAKMAGNNAKAEAAYKDAKSLQKNDPYVQLLASRLEKNNEKSLAYVDSILSIDPDNAVILLEKGKIYYKTAQFHHAVSTLDNAFIIFDKEGLTAYREVYSPLRANAWELYSLSDLSGSTTLVSTDLQAPLTRANLIDLAVANSSFFDSKRTAEAFLNRINIAENAISRRLCARFIWNAWVQKSGNPKMLNRYSQKYQASGRTKSPVADVAVDDEDFDAILGVVENEFIELPDGRNFNPDGEVLNREFLSWIKKADK